MQFDEDQRLHNSMQVDSQVLQRLLGDIRASSDQRKRVVVLSEAAYVSIRLQSFV